MKARVWTCDRCGTTVAVPYETLIVEEWSPKAIRKRVRAAGPGELGGVL